MLNDIIKKAFIGTAYEGSVFNPPSDFFEDYYIRSYIHIVVSWLIDFAFNGGDWSSTKKGEFSLEAYSVIDPSGTLWNQIVEIGKNPEINAQLMENQDYKNGTQDGFTYIGSIYKKLKPDDPDPILAKAKELAPKLKEQNEALGLFDGDDHLAAAVYMLTFYKYVRDKWC